MHLTPADTEKLLLAVAGMVARDRLAQLGRAHVGGVLGEVRVERLVRGRRDVGRRRKVGLADLEVNDVAALSLERACLGQHLERGLGAEP